MWKLSNEWPSNYYYLNGMKTHSGMPSFSKFIYLLSKKGVTLKGSKFFPVIVDPFQIPKK